MSQTKGCAVLLRPLSVLYGWGVALRNLFFDVGLLKQRTYPIPIICVGNITVGGTGKTPHIEYILEILSPHMRIAVVSRGYKRKTKGLVIASLDSSASDIGDEPKQIQLKFPKVQIAVDGNRRRAIEALISLPKEQRPELILMDDGFQHRYVKPSHSILLLDINRLPMEDNLLPLGRLRESTQALNRASSIIVTKCNPEMQPIEYSLLRRQINAFPYQQVFFSAIRYAHPMRLSGLGVGGVDKGISPPSGAKVMALSGIASPAPFLEELERSYHLVDSIIYGDHHHFSTRDIQEIIARYQSLRSQISPEPVYLITTEKDAVRLIDSLGQFPSELQEYLYYLPIRIGILDHPEQFTRMIRKASRRKH